MWKWFNTDQLLQELNAFWPKLLFAAVVLIIGLILVRVVLGLLRRGLLKSKIDPAFHGFFLSLAKIGLYVFLLIVVLTTLGVAPTSLITVLGAVGLALSLAVKDSLSNLAGGFLVLFSHPFGIGDYISLEGVEGTVKSINILYTCLNTVDNKCVFIPNGQVSNATITNYSAEETRRLDLKFSIDYGDDLLQAKVILEQLAEENPLSLDDPAPMVRVCEQGDSAIVLLLRVWSKTEDYWDLYYDMQEQVKLAFDRAGITIPYQKMDIHLAQ